MSPLLSRHIKTRFAPSPSGPIHLGHLLAALEAQRLAQESGGECLLRIEDIDTRCTSHWTRLMYEDLRWLGLHFSGEVMIQSERFDIYASYLQKLRELGLLYPCFCTRAQMKLQMEESGRAPHSSLGYQYEGKCRVLSADLAARRISAAEPHAWRLDMRATEDLIGRPCWHDVHQGSQICQPSQWGDVVLARKEFPASYHLCVVIDDALQGITHVTRGKDLFEATHIQVCLQEIFGFNRPQYLHHELLCDEQGKRLAKRDGARSIAAMRESGMQADEIRGLLALALAQDGRCSF